MILVDLQSAILKIGKEVQIALSIHSQGKISLRRERARLLPIKEKVRYLKTNLLPNKLLALKLKTLLKPDLPKLLRKP